VKLNKSGDPSSGTAFSHGGAFTAKNAAVRGLIQEAYRLKDDRILGGPGWLDAERYDIIAKPSAPVSDDEGRIMLQTLLADRFHFQAHRETREFRAYALSIAKNGLKIKEATDSNCVPAPVGLPSGPKPKAGYCGGSVVTYGQLTSRKVSMMRFAGALEEIMGRPVSDMTGLKGVFDIELKWAPDETQFGGKGKNDDSGGPSIFAALHELGLALEARKIAGDVLVIDHVERPAEN
jgi:uncharacterized protein (TIGR03435 family)